MKEVAVCLILNQNLSLSQFSINNLISKTNGKYRLYIFCLDKNEEIEVYLNKLKKHNDCYFKFYPKNTDISDLYNAFLEMVYQDYIVFMKPNILITKNWLNELIYNYEDIKNSGCISIKSNSNNLVLTSLLSNSLDSKGEEKMKTVYVNHKNLIRDFIFFKRDRLQKVGKFDKRDNIKGLELSEFSFRFIAHGYNNFWLKYATVNKFEFEDDILFPKITDEVKQNFKMLADTMIKKQQFKK